MSVCAGRIEGRVSMYVCGIEGGMNVGGRDSVGWVSEFPRKGALRTTSSPAPSNDRHLAYCLLVPSKHGCCRGPTPPSATTGGSPPGTALPVDSFHQTSPVAMRFKQASPKKHR